MDFDKVLNLRQSVRSFLDDEISKNDVEYILKAGKISAVARGLYDDYKLFVIKGKKLDELQHFMELNSPRKDCTFGAPLVIVLCTKEDEKGSSRFGFRIGSRTSW